MVTDPPYGTGGWRRRHAGQGGNPNGALIRETWDDGCLDFVREFSGTCLMTFWPAGSVMHLLAAANKQMLSKHRALYMQKLDPYPQFGGRTRWSVEPIWVLTVEGFQLKGGTDWFSCSTPRSGRDADATGHPYQKPVEVMEWAIAKLPHKAEILDPFAGSGTTLLREEPRPDRLPDLTAGLRLLTEQLRDGTLPEMTPEIRALADRALQRLDERKDEDVEAWAWRLAKDVADATD
jgi:hypothetical protein